jgi:transcriptional regulator GlxA family with amidase domain
MARDLIICCDGTGNDTVGAVTNVFRLYRCLDRDDASQLAHYDAGVGTLTDPRPVADGGDGPDRADVHPAFQAASRAIEVSLGSTVAIPTLASAAGVSHNHLIRLFRKHAGTTIADYVRRRRADRAMHLLTQTTLAPKAIASMVGLPDLQQFNKLVRRAFGRSPRQLRADLKQG